MSPNAQGALWIVAGTLLFSLNDAAVKFLGKSMTPFEIVWVRYALGLVFLSPVFVRVGWSGLKTQRLGFHIARAVVACTAQVAAYFALIELMLADATAISFSRPLFQTALAVLILGEIVGRRRWWATAIGFVGVLIMVRPGMAGFQTMSIAAVGAALLFGYSLILIRQLARTEPTPRILFYYHLLGAIFFAAPAMHDWVTPDWTQAGLLLLVGALTTGAMWCFVRGYTLGEASFIGPIEYVRLVYAALIGYFVFAELPDAWTTAGAAIIVASTLYIARVEGRRGGGAAG
jgi:drug/metabolite transporter (DMT)-like permease